MYIIHNAIKFTDRGGQVWVQVTAYDGAATITVRDTGVGMSRKWYGTDLPPSTRQTIASAVAAEA